MTLVVVLFVVGVVVMFCLAVPMLVEGDTLAGTASAATMFMLAGSLVFVPVLRHTLEAW
jgi:hypothetical protein